MLGILRHRKLEDRHAAHDHHQQGDHDRDDRAVDEELRHGQSAAADVRLRDDLSAGVRLLRAFHDHELSALESALDHPERVDARTDDDRLNAHRAVCG